MSATVSATFEQVANVTSRAAVRTHQLTVDRSVTKGGADRGPSGGEYLLVGLGGCFTSHLLAAIQARDAGMTNVLVTARGTMDGNPERFTAFSLDVTGDCPDTELARKLVVIAGRGCQVVNTLRRSAPVTISYGGSPIHFDEMTAAAGAHGGD